MSNNLSTDGDYSFSRSVGLRANYTYSILHVGRVYVTQAAPSSALNYFDTTVHNVAIGPTYTFDGGDTLFLKYNYLTSDQSNTAGSSPTITFYFAIDPARVCDENRAGLDGEDQWRGYDSRAGGQPDFFLGELLPDK